MLRHAARFLVFFLILLAAAPAPAKKCKKGKKPCGDSCIPARKVCKEAAAPAAPGKSASPAQDAKVLASASTAAVAAALEGAAGKAMLQLARTLKQAEALDVTDAQRATFRQGLRGQRAPLPICDISHVQLVRDCDAVVGGTVTLYCYLAVDEMAAVCELLGQKMPPVK